MLSVHCTDCSFPCSSFNPFSILGMFLSLPSIPNFLQKIDVSSLLWQELMNKLPRRRRDPQWKTPPGADRDLGAGQGRQRGDERTQETASDVGTRCGVQTQSQAAEAGGGWRVAGVDDVQVDGVSLRERRWGAGATERGDTATNGYWWGGGRMEEANIAIQKNGWNRWGGRARIKGLMLATEPRYQAVPVRGWNTTTSWFGHTTHTSDRITNTHIHKITLRSNRITQKKYCHGHW